MERHDGNREDTLELCWRTSVLTNGSETCVYWRGNPNVYTGAASLEDI